MRYWWVNRNQTFRQEIEGGYLWSPKCNQNGHRNPFYEFMREVSPGDLVFSFCDTRIDALGIVSGYCRESPKPEEFGAAGTNWSQIGWRAGSGFRMRSVPRITLHGSDRRKYSPSPSLSSIGLPNRCVRSTVSVVSFARSIRPLHRKELIRWLSVGRIPECLQHSGIRLVRRIAATGLATDQLSS